MNCKQVLVWRKDLNVRKGKIAAQLAHASMAPIFGMMQKHIDEKINYTITVDENHPFVSFKEGRFKKIVVSVENEQQLLELYSKIKQTNIPCALICDAGLTEFNNVPTNTAIGIGPWWDEEIDVFTKHLPLL